MTNQGRLKSSWSNSAILTFAQKPVALLGPKKGRIWIIVTALRCKKEELPNVKDKGRLIFEQNEPGWLLGLFCSVEVVITVSQSLRDIANLRENRTLISVRTLGVGILIIDSIYQQIKPVNIKVI